jgi:hypothetical protein
MIKHPDSTDDHLPKVGFPIGAPCPVAINRAEKLFPAEFLGDNTPQIPI